MKLRHLLATALLIAGTAASAQDGQAVTADAGFGAAGLGDCRTDLLYLNQLFGWQVQWGPAWGALREASEEEAKQALSRWKAAPAALRRVEEALSSTKAGEGAPRFVVERVIPQVADLAASVRSGAPPLGASVSTATQAEWRRLFAEEIAPALERHRAFLQDRYMPLASRSAGLSGTPDGPKCFANSVRYFTTLDLPAAEIEAIGWRLLNETKADLAKLYGIRLSQVPRLLATLREGPQEEFSAEQLVKLSEAAITRATAAMPRMFNRPVVRSVNVEPLPRQMEASFAAGYYQPGGGSEPATYVINLSRPKDRRLMAEVIAFHEALPGHHIRQALDLPRGTFNSGFGEGWALYSEYVADEMGLYGGKLDRAGMMAKHLWAASRLVVEPGLHLRGWTRDQALAFMREHTALSDAEIALEVDRYIATPGQSLSYMLGYDRIASARRYAERKLGRKFDLRQFHEVVLAKGSRPLNEVHSDVVRWADARKG